MLNKAYFLVFNIIIATSAAAWAESSEIKQSQAFNLRAQVDTYKQRYNLKDVYTKRTDNQGDGFEDLYGTRNLRLVLHGVLYRGGANNKYNKYGTRNNMNPLPTLGLKNLCEEGFSESIYLYRENFSTAPARTSCKNLNNESQALRYRQFTAFDAAQQEAILKTVHSHIKGEVKGPLYSHCWNGWHASGLVAAISLRQFCGWTAAQADAYWVRNTDGNSEGYDGVRRRIRDFKPTSQFAISKAERDLICPAP